MRQKSSALLSLPLSSSTPLMSTLRESSKDALRRRCSATSAIFNTVEPRLCSSDRVYHRRIVDSSYGLHRNSCRHGCDSKAAGGSQPHYLTISLPPTARDQPGDGQGDAGQREAQDREHGAYLSISSDLSVPTYIDEVLRLARSTRKRHEYAFTRTKLSRTRRSRTVTTND